MEPNSASLISLLKAFVHEEAPSKEELPADWEEVYRLARIHSVSGIVYLMSSYEQTEDRLDPSTLQALKKDFASTLARAVVQEREMDQAERQLSQYAIPHILFKGHILKTIYPVQELRTMGDIDLLIRPADRERSHAALLQLGYKAETAAGDVWTYVKGEIRLEVHVRLVSQNLGRTAESGVPVPVYFDGVWDHALIQRPGGFTHELTIDYHFLYLLVHTAKHFHGNGCGVRMIMDLAVYLLRHKDKLDAGWLAAELSRLELDAFANHMFSLCRRWFGISLPEGLACSDMGESLYREIGDYIVAAGTFGFYGRNRYTSLVRIRLKEVKGSGLLGVYLSICFPNYETMSSFKAYSFLNKWPALLPAAWAMRAVRVLVLRTGSTFGTLAGVVSGKRGCREQEDLLARLGL